MLLSVKAPLKSSDYSFANAIVFRQPKINSKLLAPNILVNC